MKYLIYTISFLFLITFAGCDNTKNIKVEAKVIQETADVEEDSLKINKCSKHKCEDKKECKDGKSCKHSCDKDSEDCKRGESCEGKQKCEKTEDIVKEHKCGEGKCAEGKCGGDSLKDEIKEDTEN